MISECQVFEDLVNHRRVRRCLYLRRNLVLRRFRRLTTQVVGLIDIIFSWRPCNFLCSSAALM